MELLKMHDFHIFCIIFVIDYVLWYYPTKIKNVRTCLPYLVRTKSHTLMSVTGKISGTQQSQWCIIHTSTKLIWSICFIACIYQVSVLELILNKFWVHKLLVDLPWQIFVCEYIATTTANVWKWFSCMRNGTKMMSILPNILPDVNFNDNFFKFWKSFLNKFWPFFERLDLAFRGEKG